MSPTSYRTAPPRVAVKGRSLWCTGPLTLLLDEGGYELAAEGGDVRDDAAPDQVKGVSGRPEYVSEGLMTLEELRAYLDELDERRADAESELAALRHSGQRLDELRAYFDLIDEHLRELPFLMQGRDGAIRDHAYTVAHEEHEREAREEGRLPIFSLSPEMFRERTPEE